MSNQNLYPVVVSSETKSHFACVTEGCNIGGPYQVDEFPGVLMRERRLGHTIIILEIDDISHKTSREKIRMLKDLQESTVEILPILDAIRINEPDPIPIPQEKKEYYSVWMNRADAARYGVVEAFQ